MPRLIQRLYGWRAVRRKTERSECTKAWLPDMSMIEDKIGELGVQVDDAAWNFGTLSIVRSLYTTPLCSVKGAGKAIREAWIDRNELLFFWLRQHLFRSPHAYQRRRLDLEPTNTEFVHSTDCKVQRNFLS
jgi:hypothetical protein